MSLLRSIEANISRIVEGTFGRVFRTNVQPVELARRLVKEMDEHQQRTVRNVYVPNRYDVYLSRDDHKQLTPHAAALTNELSEYLAEHARQNDYSLLTRPKVHLNLDRELKLGAFGIAVKVEQPSEAEHVIEKAAAPTLAPAAPAAPTLAPPLTTTESFALFGDTAPYPLSSSPVSIGRGRANDIALTDASVSREHAQLVKIGDEWHVRDLESTNGVTVNGARTETQQPLKIGDEISFGNVRMRFDIFTTGED